MPLQHSEEFVAAFGFAAMLVGVLLTIPGEGFDVRRL